MKKTPTKKTPTKKTLDILEVPKKFIPASIQDGVSNQFSGFSNFLGKYSIVSMAIGVIIGQTTKDVVSTLVTGIISPALALIFKFIVPTSNLKTIVIDFNGSQFLVGEFLNTFIEMLLIMLIIYIVIGVIFRQKEIIGVQEKEIKAQDKEIKKLKK